jgi:hypothetical protein
MSKSSVKSHSHKKNPRRLVTGSKTGREAILIIVAIILAGIPFYLGKYFELNCPDAFDSGSNVYSAERILDGARIDIDEKPSAATGTLLVNMLGVWLFGFSETGPKLLQGLFQLAAFVLMFVSMRRLFGSLAAVLGVVVASVYLSAPLMAKYGNVKDQFMIACMIMGISCFVMRQLTHRVWWAVFAGVFLAWAPLFKETGTSAAGAVGLFVLVGALTKNRSWKDTFADVALMLGGAAITLLPVYIWLWLEDASPLRWPYFKILKIILPLGGPSIGTYISGGQEAINFSELAPRVFRYYALLILPIGLALASALVAAVRWILGKAGKFAIEVKDYERFVLLFASWWVLDMAFVWISPRSYEQYYLPLNASAAMLGGYMVALYRDRVSSTPFRGRWIAIGAGVVMCMVIMSWHIFFGIEKSPHSGTFYGRKTRGYLQKYREISLRCRDDLQAPWEVVGDYIRAHSTADDRIYVWGWFPGIYVRAQRVSSAPKAFFGTMHTAEPEELKQVIDETIGAFEKVPPKFIVDSRKIHFPWNRPPFELWPRTGNSFLPNNDAVMAEYEREFAALLAEKYGQQEAERYRAMLPLRRFVMHNYRIVPIQFGEHVLFERK